jgi:hypothetical protein
MSKSTAILIFVRWRSQRRPQFGRERCVLIVLAESDWPEDVILGMTGKMARGLCHGRVWTVRARI